MDMSNSNVSFCVRAVKTLSNFDIDALTQSMEAYFMAGMPMSKAGPAAVSDLLATVISEREEMVRLVREQHPQCFLRQDWDGDD